MGQFEDLKPKVHKEIFRHLDWHTLLKCRLLSHSLKTIADQVAQHRLESAAAQAEILRNWNPYFTVRRYFDLNTQNILGMVRLECAQDLKNFMAMAGTATVLPEQRPSGNTAMPSAESENPSPATSGSAQSTPLFPLRSVHIRRRLQDYQTDPDDPPADSHQEIFDLTLIFVQKFGHLLTSFTFDDGKRKGSDLSFVALTKILENLPNLVCLGITSGNYEHHNFSKGRDRFGVKRLPPSPKLLCVNLGFNVTFHLHMDILNSYGGQLRRIVCSRFGHLLTTPAPYSTSNSLVRLLDYVNSIRKLHPEVLSSLEELKVPVISSENIMHEIKVDTVPAASPILWSNLTRLSIFYVYMTGHSKSGLVDLFLFFNHFSPTLQEVTIDFESCRDFLCWESMDHRPFDKDVYRRCKALTKLSLAAFCLEKHSEMLDLIALKFSDVQSVTFFNWDAYHAEAVHAQFKGYSGAAKDDKFMHRYMIHFWTKLVHLKRLSVRSKTWKGEGIYEQHRQ